MLSTIASSISDIALVLIGTTITIFVLTVTFLVKAAEVTKEKKIEAEQKANDEFDQDIVVINKKIKDNPHDTKGLREEIEKIEIKKTYADKLIKDLDAKYNALGLDEGVIIPCLLFLLAIIFSRWFTVSFNDLLFGFIIIFLSLFFLLCGICKIILTLQSIQYFSLNIKNDQADQVQSEKMIEAITQTLKNIDDSKEPKPQITFSEKTPFIFKLNREQKLDFKLNLKENGAVEAKNLDIWFLFSPEIEIIDGSNYSKPFKQSKNYPIPNANTTKYKLNTIRKHSFFEGSIKVKPTMIGEFKLRYKVDCDNHSEPSATNKEITILVQE